MCGCVYVYVCMHKGVRVACWGAYTGMPQDSSSTRKAESSHFHPSPPTPAHPPHTLSQSTRPRPRPNISDSPVKLLLQTPQPLEKIEGSAFSSFSSYNAGQSVRDVDALRHGGLRVMRPVASTIYKAATVRLIKKAELPMRERVITRPITMTVK